MRRKNQCFASMLVSSALLLPVGAMAMPRLQDDRDHERHEQEEHERRVYDPLYRDYHNWTSREEAAFRQWLTDRHHDYVDYGQLDARDQHDYWKWRHREEKREQHEEHEEHEHQ
jgi:hypothetical protein